MLCLAMQNPRRTREHNDWNMIQFDVKINKHNQVTEH